MNATIRYLLEGALADIDYARRELSKPNPHAFGVVAKQSPLDRKTRSVLCLASWALRFVLGTRSTAAGMTHRSQQDAGIALRRQLQLTEEALRDDE